MAKQNVNIESALLRAPSSYTMHWRGNDVLFTDNIMDFAPFDRPRQFDATAVFLCVSGSMECKVDLDTYVLKKNSLLMIFPGQLVSVISNNGAKGYATLMSSAFVNHIKLEHMKRTNFDVHIGIKPMCQVNTAEMEAYKRIYTLACKVLPQSAEEAPHVAMGLARAFYAMVISSMKAHAGAAATVAENSTPNHRQIFNRFIDLLAENHAEHHSITFYAKEMSLSLKYLSLVVKECSGRTVQDWVNQYVMLLAKSLLANSQMSIKQITDTLHFQNQSTFGKYFKKHAGIGPKDYRNAFRTVTTTEK